MYFIQICKSQYCLFFSYILYHAYGWREITILVDKRKVYQLQIVSQRFHASGARNYVLDGKLVDIIGEGSS
jgi:hypothetical protein